MIIGFTCGAFDLLHPGHLLLFQFAKKSCDHLIVGLHTDPTIDRPQTKRKPLQTTLERFIQLESCKFVNQIIPYDTERDLKNLLLSLQVDVRIIGEDYIGKSFTGDDIKSIKVVYAPRAHDYSSTLFVKKLNGTENR